MRSGRSGMKRYIFVAICSILVILWIAFIWLNSMQPVDKSLEISSGVTDRLNNAINEIVDSLQREPVTTAPEATEPTTTKPATEDPTTTKPETTKPETTKPETTVPVTTEPVLKDRVVRKSAHFLEYMLLGILAAIDVAAISKAILRRRSLFAALFMPISVALSFAVSAIDEFVIQAATEGRGPSWRDVGIDCGGAATGALICILVFLVTYYFAKAREKKTTSQI